MLNDPPRELVAWLATALRFDNLKIDPLPPEASTRRFFRVTNDAGESWMAIHAPPATEDNERFVALAEVFRRHGVAVPTIHASDLTQGFIVVDDFGEMEFLHVYGDARARQTAIGLALDGLVAIQYTADASIQPYTRQRLLDELKIFEEWCCKTMLRRGATPLAAIAGALTREIDGHPKVTIHRDYHSRNLLLNEESLGIVDFQDALVGSCAYDIASLLYDCYFEHGTTEISDWIDGFRARLAGTDLPRIHSREEFVRAIEITAVQRMLKAVGIFCRLWFVQRKATHLPYTVPVLRRIVELAKRNDLQRLAAWLESDIGPALSTSIERLPA